MKTGGAGSRWHDEGGQAPRVDRPAAELDQLYRCRWGAVGLGRPDQRRAALCLALSCLVLSCLASLSATVAGLCSLTRYRWDVDVVGVCEATNAIIQSIQQKHEDYEMS